MTKKKGINKGWYVLGVVVILGAIWMFAPKPTQNVAYDTKKAEIGDIKTYYQFSGMIEAIDKQMVVLNTVAEIESLEVMEGDHVQEDDLLFTTTQGARVYAALDGEVTSLNISQGDIVAAGSPLLSVVNFDELKVNIKVDEFDISHVFVNDNVEVYVEALDKTVSGVITRVSKEATFLNGISYFDATVELEADEALRVGFTSEVKLLEASVEGAVVLPVSAIQYDKDNSPYILMYNDKSEVIKKEVKLGITDGVKVEVIEGLAANDEVLVEKEIMMPPGFSARKSTK